MKGLAKDTTKPVVTVISESRSQADVVFTLDTVNGKGTLIPDNVVVIAYPVIPNVVDEFVAQLQFSTTFEVMEFSARHKIKLS